MPSSFPAKPRLLIIHVIIIVITSSSSNTCLFIIPQGQPCWQWDRNHKLAWHSAISGTDGQLLNGCQINKGMGGGVFLSLARDGGVQCQVSVRDGGPPHPWLHVGRPLALFMQVGGCLSNVLSHGWMTFIVKIIPPSVGVHPYPHIRIGFISLPQHVRSLHC